MFPELIVLSTVIPILVGFWGKGEGERGKKKPLTFTL